MWHPSPRVPTTGGKQILFRRSSLRDSLQPVFLQEDRKYLRNKAACAPFALVGGNEIFAQAPCALLGGNELSPRSRRCTSSLFHMVGPASDNVAPKSTSPRHRRTANIVSPELPARQLAASVLQKARKQLLCKAACAQLALARGNEIFARVPCSHVRGNELSPISRRRIFSSFHLVGPASDNVASKSTSPQHRRKANTVSRKLPARQLAASVPTRGQEVLVL